MRLSAVRGCEHHVIACLDKGHHRNDGFVEIVASGTGAAALHLDAGSVGTEYKNFAITHLTSPLSDVQVRLYRRILLYRSCASSASPSHSPLVVRLIIAP